MKMNKKNCISSMVISLVLMLMTLFAWPQRAAAAAYTAPASDITVGTTVPDINDGDSLCSLIEALENANDTGSGQPYTDCPPGDAAGPDTIILTVGELYTLTTVYTDSSGLPAIDTEITIEGNGATIARDPAAGEDFRIFRVLAGGSLTISDTVLANGIANIGGAIYTQSDVVLANSTLTNNESTATDASTGGGGAVMVRDGYLTATNTTFVSNEAQRGGAIFAASGYVTLTQSTAISNTVVRFGGAIYTIGSADLTVMQSTMTHNVGTSGGGGLYANGAVHTISDSTWAFNSGSAGGSIYFTGGTNRVANSTFFSNTASASGGTIRMSSGTTTFANVTISHGKGNSGGGIHKSGGTLNLLNTVVANSINGGDCNGTLDTITNSLIEDGTCGASLTGDPALLDLADNGGPTWTMLPDAFSPIIDAGDNATCEATDQRGVDRPDGDTCDIGAVEHTVCPFFLNPIADGDTAALIDMLALLQQCPDLNTITLANDGIYRFTTFDNNETDVGRTALPWIKTDITLVGNGATLVRSGGEVVRFFYVDSGGALTLDDLTLETGWADGSGSGGGAVRVGSGGALTMTNSYLEGNAAYNSAVGGALFIENGGALYIADSSLTNNQANGKGGAIYLDSTTTVTITHSTFTENTSDQTGGGIHNGGMLYLIDSSLRDNQAAFGGAINNVRFVSISGSTFVTNTADLSGGALFNGDLAQIGNSTFSDNLANAGGAIYSGGYLYGYNNTFAKNSATLAGAAFYGDVVFQMHNSIIADNSGPSSCYGGAISGVSNTSIADGSGCGNATHATNILLGPLLDNGGSTLTHALLTGSDGLDVGNATFCAGTYVNSVDQRGVARPQGVACDVGAYEAIVYTLTVNSEGSGLVTRDPNQTTFTEGTIVTLTASANNDWYFSTWSGDVVTSTNSVTLTMNSSKVITASFNIFTHTVNITTNGTGLGTVTLNPPGGVYEFGTVVTATATVSTGSFFEGWSGDISGTTTPLTLTVDSDKSITASFGLLTYTVDVGVTGSGIGEVTLDPPGGIYDYGTVVTATVTVSEGSSFVGWHGDLSGTTTPLTFTIDSPKRITASLGLLTYTVAVDVAGTGVGEVALDPPGGVYEYGTVVTATVAVSTESSFAGWSGSETGTDTPTTILVDGDKQLTATFTLNQYSVAVATDGVGSGVVALDPPGGVYDYGTAVTATATAETGSTFSAWDGDVVSSSNPLTLTVDGDKAITATFALNQHTLEVSTAGAGNGVVTLEPLGGVYAYGTVVTLTTSNDNGSAFAGWSGDLAGMDNPITMTIIGDHAVTATFDLLTYTLGVNVDGIGSGIVSLDPSGGIYDYGTVVTVTATADIGSSFAAWTGDLTSKDNPTTITIDSDKSITATFAEVTPVTYTLTVNVVGNGVVTPTSGSYAAGAVVPLTADADAGWSFAGWSGDLDETDSTTTITLDSDKTITATFEAETVPTHTLTVNVVGNGVVTPTGGSFAAGMIVTLTATADEGWSFEGWRGDIQGASNPTTLTMDANVVVTATFVESTEDSGNITPVVSAAAQQTVTVGISQTLALGSFDDNPADAPWQVTVNWGDGITDTPFSVNSVGDLPTQLHTYTVAGTYTVTVQVDDGMDVGLATFNVIANDPVEEPDEFGSISGIVYADANTNDSYDEGEGVEGAVVSLGEMGIAAQGDFTTETSTGTDGSFTLINVPAGDYVLSIIADGYETVVTSVVVTAGETLEMVPQAIIPTAEGTDAGTVVFLPMVSTTAEAAARSQNLVPIEQTQINMIFLPITRR